MGKRNRINWKEIIPEAERICRDHYNRYGVQLTLRGLFYILVSKGLIPNTKSAYKGLSRVLSKRRYEGKFSWDLIKDETRPSINLEDYEYYPTRPLSEEELKRAILNYIEQHTDVSVNPWEDQKYRVIVVVEKRALYDHFKRFIREVFPFGVYRVIPIRGYDSATDVKKVSDLVRSIREFHEQMPVILQFGDFDPSGEDIKRDFQERVKMLSKTKDIIFDVVAVKIDHIFKYNLPASPESLEEIEKLKRDPRYPKFIQKLMEHEDPRVRELVKKTGGLVRVEIDALVELVTEEFKKILKAAIEKYFDWEIYNTKTKEREKELKKKAEEYKRQSYENLKKLLREEQ